MLMRVLFVFALCVLLPSAIRGQAFAPTAARATLATAVDSATEVRLRDGTVYVGEVEEETAERIVLRTRAGTRVEIAVAQIASRRRVELRPDGAVWPDDPNRTRLFFASTARALGKGEGYVSSYWLFFPFVAYGITDNMTIAGGTPIIPGAIGELLYFAPKVTVWERERSSFAVGALGFFSTAEFDEGSVGILYGVTTIGSRDKALTFGAGWGYEQVTPGGSVANNPVLMIGGELRTGRSVKLVTENWIGTSDGFEGLMSGGVRFFGERLSADLALGTFGGTQCCFPLVNFVWAFGGSGRGR